MHAKCCDCETALHKIGCRLIQTVAPWVCAVVFIGNGCVSVPISPVKKHKLSEQEIARMSPSWFRDVSTTAARDVSISANLANNKTLLLEAICTKDELSWRYTTFLRQTRIIVGIFPVLDAQPSQEEEDFALIALLGIPSGLCSLMLREADAFRWMLLQPVYLAASILVSPINWIAEPFSEPDKSQWWDYAFLGFYKTEHSETDQSQRDDMQMRTFTESVPVDCIVTFGGTNIVWKNDRRSERFQIDLSRLPIIDNGDVILSVTVSARNLTATTNVVVPAGSSIGQAFLTGSERMPDVLWYFGQPLDLSVSPLTAAPNAQATFEITKSAAPGGTGELQVVVQNTGQGPLCRLIGFLRSERIEWNRRAIPFGRIEPGERVARSVSLPIPKDMAPGTYPLRVVFNEAYDYFAPEDLAVNFPVLTFEKPMLALRCRVDDTPSVDGKTLGNGDGVVQEKETFDLVVQVMNTGKLPAKDVVLSVELQQDRWLTVFGERRFNLGEVKPGEIVERRINMAVGSRLKSDALWATIHAREGSFPTDTWLRIQLPYDTRTARQPVALDATFYVGADHIILREGASERAAAFDVAHRGATLRAVAELNEWIQVEVESRAGADTVLRRLWVLRRDLTTTPPQGTRANSDGVPMN